MPVTVTSEETARLADKIYQDELRAQLEPTHLGEYLVLDVETHDYEVDGDRIAAIDRIRAGRPTARLFMLRIGHRASVKLGTRRLLRGE